MTRDERKEYNFWLTRRKVNGVIEKRCTLCGKWLEENLNNFYLMNKSHPERGYSASCRKCLTDKSIERRHKDIEETRKSDLEYYYNNKDKCFGRMKNYKTNHKEKVNENHKDWTRKNPDKCRDYTKRHRIHDITETEWRSCLKVFDNQCAYCGLLYKEHIVKRNGKYIIMNFHKEHVDDEGYNDLRNAIPACQSCNSSKHQSGLDDWYKQQKFYTEERYNKIIWWITEGYKQYIEEKLPYRIIREKNQNDNKFHWNLWNVDEMRNLVDIITTKDTKKDLSEDIQKYYADILY